MPVSFFSKSHGGTEYIANIYFVVCAFVNNKLYVYSTIVHVKGEFADLEQGKEWIQAWCSQNIKKGT